MKPLLPLFFILLSLSSVAQMCPGGGVDFSSAVAFDPNWIYGCNTGTSCNGGVNFSNLASCQPTTALDACAPAPSCGSIGNSASNIWFKFYPLSPTATISCFQNSSFVIGIQAFSGGPACGSLTQIGCSVAGGLSSGVQLSLTGLVPGQLYYFRIFGSSTPVSQRSGIYCFCGTTGLNNVVLPVSLASFRGFVAGDRVDLQWTTSASDHYPFFEVQRSTDGSSFADIARVDGAGPVGGSGSAGSSVFAGGPAAYSYSDELGTADTLFYRLKVYSDDIHYTYSTVVAVKQQTGDGLRLFFDAAGKELQITVQQSTRVAIVNTAGMPMKTLLLTPGKNYISVASLAAGIYFLHQMNGNANRRFFVFN